MTSWQEIELEISALNGAAKRWRRWILRAQTSSQCTRVQQLLEVCADPAGGIIRKAGGRRELLQRQLAQMSQLEAEARRLRMPPGAAGIPRVGLSNIRLEDPGQAAAAARAAGVGARPQAMIHGGGKYLKPVTPPTATCSHLHVKSGANDKGANTVCSTCDMKSNMPKYDKGQLAAYNAGQLPSWEVLPGHAAQATKAQQCHPTAAATTTAASHRNGGAAARANPSTGGSAASSSNKLPPGHPLLIGGAAAQQQAQTGYWGQPPNHQGCAPECGPQRPALSQLFQRLLRVGRTQMMGSPSKQEDTMMHSMPTQAAHGPISNEPMCPLCRVFMITKVNHSTGAPFWSCPRWPSCTGKLPIQVDRNVQQESHGIAEHHVVPHAPIAELCSVVPRTPRPWLSTPTLLLRSDRRPEWACKYPTHQSRSTGDPEAAVMRIARSTR